MPNAFCLPSAHEADKQQPMSTVDSPSPPCLSCCQPGCSLTLSLRDGHTLAACRCALSAGSPVLRHALSLKLPTPGGCPTHCCLRYGSTCRLA